MIIATQLLLSLFAFTSPTSGLPDVCDQTLDTIDAPRYCQAHHEGAPAWDRPVCCNDETCFVQPLGGCEAGEAAFQCDYGEITGRDVVQCYFVVPNFCDVHDCPAPAEVPGYQSAGEADYLCCAFGDCYLYNPKIGYCPGEILYCIAPFSNPDGTIGCSDYD